MRVGRRGDVGYVTGEALAQIGAGAGFNIRPPVGEIWRVISWRATLTTDATVTNRFMMWHIYDGTNFASTFRTAVPQGASLSYVYCVNPWNPVNALGIVPFVNFDWSMDIFVNNTWYWYVFPDGIQAGDNFSQIFAFVEKWLAE